MTLLTVCCRILQVYSLTEYIKSQIAFSDTVMSLLLANFLTIGSIVNAPGIRRFGKFDSSLPLFNSVDIAATDADSGSLDVEPLKLQVPLIIETS